MLNGKRVLKMVWSRHSVKPNGRDPVPRPAKYRYPTLETYDPYLVDIVRMLEQLRNGTRH